MSARQSWNGYSPKKRRLAGLWVFVVLCLLGALGFAWLRFTPLNRFSAASLRALRSDPEAVFYSIEPWSEANGQQGFRGHHIVGQHRLAVQGEREAIAGWIAAAARGAWDRAACFNPRHGFRARGPEGTYDFLLCFEWTFFDFEVRAFPSKKEPIWKSRRTAKRWGGGMTAISSGMP